MIYADRDKPLDIPKTVATCPDCGKELLIEIQEWDTDSYQVTDVGFEIYCSGERTVEALPIDRWIRDWLPVQAKIHTWLSENVQVARATKADLERWAEAVKDWQVAA